jgi:hypothetical protein
MGAAAEKGSAHVAVVTENLQMARKPLALEHQVKTHAWTPFLAVLLAVVVNVVEAEEDDVVLAAAGTGGVSVAVVHENFVAETTAIFTAGLPVAVLAVPLEPVDVVAVGGEVVVVERERSLAHTAAPRCRLCESFAPAGGRAATGKGLDTQGDFLATPALAANLPRAAWDVFQDRQPPKLLADKGRKPIRDFAVLPAVSHLRSPGRVRCHL